MFEKGQLMKIHYLIWFNTCEIIDPNFSHALNSLKLLEKEKHYIQESEQSIWRSTVYTAEFF